MTKSLREPPRNSVSTIVVDFSMSHSLFFRRFIYKHKNISFLRKTLLFIVFVFFLISREYIAACLFEIFLFCKSSPIMKIYFDVFTGDELGSDSYPTKVVDDLYYEVEGKVREKQQSSRKSHGYNVVFLEYHRKQ